MFDEVKNRLEEMGQAFEAFKARYDERLDGETRERQELELKIGRIGLSGTFSGGESEKRELKAIGETLRIFIKSGDLTPLNRLFEQKAMSVGSDPAGGYTVLPTFSTAITKRVFQISPIRPYARVVTISTDAFEEILDLNEPDAAWVGEVQPRLDTDTPNIGKLRIPVQEIYAMPKVTQTLLDDSAIDIGQWLVDKVSRRFARMECAAFVAGDGIGKPRGFLSYSTTSQGDDARDWGVLQYVPTGGASDFASSNPGDALIDVQTALQPDYRGSAIWLMNRATAGKVRKFKDTQGRYLWQESLQQGAPPMLLGHPVVLAEDMSDVGSNTYPVAFGDFNAGYTIVDREGDRLLRDPYTDKPNVRFYTYRRVGGDVNNFEAIKLLKCATS